MDASSDDTTEKKPKSEDRQKIETSDESKKARL